MADPENVGAGDSTPNPRQIPEITPPPYGKVVSDTWVIEGMMQVQKTLGELSATVSSLKSASDKQGTKLDRISHLIFASGVVMTIVLAIFGFFINKIFDSVVALIRSGH